MQPPDQWFPITTERLLLREFRNVDESDIHEYGGDPAVSTFTDWGPNTPADTRTVLQERLRAQRVWPRLEVALAVELVAERKVIGSIDLTIDPRAPQTASFGYAFNRAYWGRGYATEASRAILQVAFDVLQLHRVWATCDTRNVASWRVMENLGMRREAEFFEDVLQKGEWRNSYLYAILDRDVASRDAAAPDATSLEQAGSNQEPAVRRLYNQQLYESRARDFASHSDSSKYNAMYERPAMLALLGDPRGKSIVDIGCGAAPLLRTLEGRGARQLVGIEVSRGLAEIARARVSEEVEIYHGDAHDVLAQLAGAGFDCAVASLVIHYIDPLEPLFRLMADALTDGGRVLLSTNVPAEEEIAKKEAVYEYWPKLGIRVARFDQTESMLRQSLANAGFEQIEITTPTPTPEMLQVSAETYTRLNAAPEFILIEALLVERRGV